MYSTIYIYIYIYYVVVLGGLPAESVFNSQGLIPRNPPSCYIPNDDDLIGLVAKNSPCQFRKLSSWNFCGNKIPRIILRGMALLIFDWIFMFEKEMKVRTKSEWDLQQLNFVEVRMSLIRQKVIFHRFIFFSFRELPEFIVSYNISSKVCIIFGMLEKCLMVHVSCKYKYVDRNKRGSVTISAIAWKSNRKSGTFSIFLSYPDWPFLNFRDSKSVNRRTLLCTSQASMDSF